MAGVMLVRKSVLEDPNKPLPPTIMASWSTPTGGDRNGQLGKSWQGAILNNPLQITDHCANTGSKAKGVAPEPSMRNEGFVGITFDKYNPRVYTGNCDTDLYLSKGNEDCRWRNCLLPSTISASRSDVQMTMAIFVC
jgi:hypothetical protein